ncbi:MAG: asparaginase [Planctomycetota bacterium]|nr:asparaginase [Planctomycetota bacterium]
MQSHLRKSLTILVRRGDYPESQHRIRAAVTRGGTLERAFGDVDAPVFARSSAKPLQAVPLILSGAADAFGLDDTEIAIACASHSGTDQHCRTVEGMLRKGDLKSSDLQCGIHAPFDIKSAEATLREGAPFDVLQNNCSGKHAGMLLLARHLGAPIESYRDPRHRVQTEILRAISRLTDSPESEIGIAIDGCGVPVHAFPLWRLALAYERLTAPDSLESDLAGAARRIVAAIRAHPFIFAGPDRLCSRLVEVLGERVTPKAGAEGVYALGIGESSIGIAIKCEDGSARGSRAAVLHLLSRLKLITPEEVERIRSLAAPAVRNFHGVVTGGLDWNGTETAPGEEG